LSLDLDSQSEQTLRFAKLCICTGARPIILKEKILNSPCKADASLNLEDLVIGIRDSDSVDNLISRLSSSMPFFIPFFPLTLTSAGSARRKRVMVVGSGGIAMEFVGSVRICDIIWVSRKDRIGSSFLDKSSAAFLVPFLFPDADPEIRTAVQDSNTTQVSSPTDQKDDTVSHIASGAALGPDWVKLLPTSNSKVKIDLELDSEITSISWSEQFTSENKEAFPLHVVLSNGVTFDCDLVISATGVIPNTEFIKNSPSCANKFEFDEENALVVNDLLQVKFFGNDEHSPDIYAAGDCCAMRLEDPCCWFQMRLWSQATVMGRYAAYCMLGLVENELGVWINFEIFSHITNFFGQKVILLGKYDGRGLGIESVDYKVMMRVKPGDSYVKVVLRNGRVVGALLIGETDLEETMENLILNQLPVDFLGDELLREDVDLEDYFD
jgi:hypothetical protein